MKELLNLNYWFNSRPEPLWPNQDKMLMVIFGSLVLVCVVTFFLKKRSGQDPYRKLWTGLFGLGWTNLLIGAVLLFFSYEMVPFLAARFWLLLWAIEAGVWLGFLIRGAAKVPATIAQLEAEKKYKQYIP